MRRLCEVADLHPETLYQRIDLIYRRLREFAANAEQNLSETGRAFAHVAVDHQDHTLNWGSSLDRRISVLKTITSADAKSGFILGQHLNFDPDINPFELELSAREVGDPERKAAFRRFARIWLPYEQSDPDAEPGEDVLAVEDVRPPSEGCMTREIYTQYGHFLFLKERLKGIERVQFSLDRDPAIVRACLLAFFDRVRDASMDACLVRIDKSLSVQEKKTALFVAQQQLEELRKHAKNVTEAELIRRVIEDRYHQVRADYQKPSQRWVSHPIPNMSEPDRFIQLLTDDGNRDIEDLCWVIARSSLRTVDRYFMQVRRRVSLLERPISSASANRRWHGYNAYSPIVVMKLLEIFRVVYNYHLKGRTKDTAAQRFGLVSAPMSLAELLN